MSLSPSNPRFLLIAVLLLLLLFPAALTAQELHTSNPDDTEIIRLKTEAYLTEQPLHRLTGTTSLESMSSRSPEGIDPFTWVAWQSVRDNNWEIMAAVDREDNIIRLTGAAGSDINPAIRPGTFDVAYVRLGEDSDIWRVGVYGPLPTALITGSANDNYPTYSPDGTTLFFASTRNGNWDIFRATAEGGDITPIISDPATDIMPTISPDGQWLVWVRAVSESQGVLMRSNIDGTNPTTLTNPISFLQNPRFSSEGSRIGFDGDINGDFWNDALYFEPSTGAIILIEAGASRRDVFFNAWSPTNPNEVLYTHLNYVTYQGQLYIANASIYGKELDSYPRALFNDTLAAMAGWGRSDNQPPIVTTSSIPEYSRVAGFAVQASHQDVGPAPFDRYELQYRLPETTNTWTYGYESPSNALFFNGAPGDLVELRVRGYDKAGNASSFAPPVQTRLYSGDLHISVHDHRGVARPFTTTLNPQPITTVYSTTEEAIYRLSTTDKTNFSVTASGFGQLPSTPLLTRESTAYSTYIPGSNNVIENGGFEGNLNGWQTGGTLLPTVAEGGHTQQRAALFSDDFGSWRVETFQQAGASLAAMDSLGRIHRAFVSDGHLQYQRRYTNGTWESATIVGPASRISDIELGYDGQVHVLYEYQGWLQYRQRSTNGSWSAPISLFNLYSSKGVLYDLTVDGIGRAHLIFNISCDVAPTPCGASSEYGFFHREYLPDGQALPDVLIAKRTSNTPFGVNLAVASMSDGTIHAWNSYHGHWIREPGTSWTGVSDSPRGLYEQYGSTRAESWMIDSQGVLHAIFNMRVSYPDVQYVWFYGRYDANQRWQLERFAPFSQPVHNDNGYGRFSLIPNGDELMVVAYSEPINVSRRFADGVWSQPMSLRPYFYTGGSPSIFYRPSEGFLFLGDTIFSKLSRPNEDQLSTMSTSVALSDLTMPTLGFMYRVEQGQMGDEGIFHVTLTNEISTTTVYETNPEVGDWTYGWADLSAWVGQTVTVTFAYEHPAATPLTLFRLDDVTVSEYIAPILTEASPNVIATDWIGQSITITGANFTTPLTASVNGITANVTIIDENTLDLIIPDGTRPGLARIAITNGANLTTEVPLLQIGLPVYLPLLSK